MKTNCIRYRFFVGLFLFSILVQPQLASITANDDSAAETGEDPGQFTVELAGLVNLPTTVNYSVGGTATAGTDYETLPGSVVLPIGALGSQATIDLTGIVDDNILEGDETVILTLEDGIGYTVDSPESAGATISDNDSASLTIEDVTETEGTDMIFMVTLDNPVEDGLTLTPGLTGGSATGGDLALVYPEDYNNSISPVVFTGTGGESQQFIVETLDDVVLEGTEVFTVSLSSSNTLVDDIDMATGTINDNDNAALTIDDVTGTEGTALQFTATLDNEVSGPFTVTTGYTDGSAIGGDAPLSPPEDYDNSPVVLNFIGNAGETQVFDVATLSDLTTEGTEDFTVDLVSSNILVTDTDIATGSIEDQLSEVDLDGDVSQNEGTGGTTNFDFTVNRTGDTSGTASVDWAVIGGGGNPANAADFAGGSFPTGTANFEAGETTAIITVIVSADSAVESNETFTVTLSDPIGVSLGAATTATGTIQNDDSQSISIGDVSLTEGNAGTKNFNFTVSVDGGGNAQNDIGFTFNTANGTATTGNGDYVAVSGGSGTITSGNSSTNVTVVVNGDTTVEPDEGFTVILSAPTNATIGDGTGQGTIENDDSYTATITATDATATEAGTTTGQFTVTLSPANATGSAITVNYTIGGSATNTSDYGTLSGTVLIPNGSGSNTVTVTPVDDSATEGTEDVIVTLATGTGYNIGGQDEATVDIADNDSAGVIVSPTSGTTTEAGGTFVFNISLTSEPTADVTVPLSSSDEDEGTVPASAVIAPGDWDTGVDVIVTGVDDTSVDGDIAYTIVTGNINSPDGAYNSLGGADAADVSMVNEDDDSLTATISVTDAVAGEAGSDDGQFTIDLGAQNGTGSNITVNYSVGGTATEGTDYNNLSGTVSIGNNQQTATININPSNDNDFEGTETVVITIQSGTGYTIGNPASASLNITDDDAATLTIGNQTVAENVASGNMVFTVTLSNAVAGGVTVGYTFANGTATGGGNDFTGTPGTLTFAGTAGEQEIITVPINNDAIVEGNETFTVTLGTPSVAGITVSGSPATGTITNDDLSVFFSSANASGLENSNTSLPTLFVSGTISTSSSVTVSVTGGTATMGSDYNFTSPQVVNIPSGIYDGTAATDIPIPNLVIANDAVVEPDETIILSLGSPTGSAVIGSPATSTYTIQNDDTYAISINDVSLAEGNSGVTDFNFVVSIVGGANALNDIDFTYNTANGSATTANNDYTGVIGGSGTIPAGSSSATVTIDVTGDTNAEDNENFTVNLTGADNATINDAQGLGTIQNDDSAGVIIGPISGNTTEDGDTAQFLVTLTSQPFFPVTINLGSSDPGEGTVPPSVSLNASNWNTGVMVTVTGVDDDLVDGPQTFTVVTNDVTSLDLAYLLLGPGDVDNLEVINEDNDGFTATITATDAEASEDGGGGSFTIDLGQANGTGSAVLVNYSIGGTANNGGDYETIPNSVSIANGQSSATVDIDPIDDDFLENTETIVLTLAPSPAYSVGEPASAQVDLTDDDSAALTINNATGEEGQDLVFTVTLNNAISGGGFTVTTGYTDVTATGGAAPLSSPEDYDNTPQELSFNGTAGETVEFSVATLTDVLPEGAETFTVTLTPSNPLIDVSDTGTGTITDSDSDDDGLSDGLEASLGTDPEDPDSDGDGIDDSTEVGDDTNNPLDEDDDGIIDALDSDTEDTDGDGVNDQQDPANENGCIPNSDSPACDTDGDGISDADEIANGSDPMDPCDPDINSPACVLGDVDLALTKLVEDPRPGGRYELGDRIIFSVTLTNLSAVPAFNIPVQEVIQSGFLFIATLSDSDYDQAASLWTVSRLDPGEEAVLRIEVEIVDGGSDGELENSVLLDPSYSLDTNPENNAATVDGIFVDLINEQDPGFLYNQFSPNGDGVNDRLVVNSIELYPGVYIQIFDRYGNSVYEARNYDNSWDGTGKNGNLPKGTYFYILDLGDGSEVRKGWIQIIR